MELAEYKIPPLDSSAMELCQRRWDSIAKPLGSLGLLEKAIIKISGLTGDASFRLDKRAVVVMCADNGVIVRGVTQAGSEVTAAVARNMVAGKGCVCCMADLANADVLPVDIGMCDCTGIPGIINKKISAGTQDIYIGTAMTKEQAVQALETGISLVKELRDKGYKIIATGEMGIGNTTTSSALASVLLGCDVESVTGRGAGLDSDGLARKIEVIHHAIEVNCPNPDDALDVLAKLGGYDIAGMAGLFLGGAIYRIPILVDGFISSIAALVAARLFPSSKCAMLASHVSAEPAGRLVLDELGLEPFICAGLRLGEGTGAVATLPLLDMAMNIYHNMSSFSDINIESYKPLA